MKFLILFLFCGALCQVPVPTMLPALVPETLTDLSREPMEDFDEIKKKAGEDDLESNVEVKADSTWPAQITVYEELRDDEASHDKSPSSDSVTEEACIDENMEWNSCGPRCSQTCAFQPRGVRKSRAICEPLLTSNGCYKGCFCKKGYVRLSDKCVLSENCPIRNCLFANEEYKQCGTPCQITCDSSRFADEIEARCPTEICVRGCFCKSGYVRSATGICVQPTRCPRPLVI